MLENEEYIPVIIEQFCEHLLARKRNIEFRILAGGCKSQEVYVCDIAKIHEIKSSLTYLNNELSKKGIQLKSLAHFGETYEQ